MSSKRKVSYYYDPEIGNYYYGHGHPMKPHRVRMAHGLIVRYGLHERMQVLKPVPLSEEIMQSFHTREYIEFLKNVTPENQDRYSKEVRNFSFVNDCPVFERIFEYCQSYTGGSVGGAVRLNHGLSDIVINWAGGLHHAKKSEASGFCYINDIVLAILELLKYHHRVLYIDIDVHHGDGVEEAFLTSDRCLTISFHKHGGDFFPGTGDLDEVGVGNGKYFSVNVPLEDGIDDDSYEDLFKPIMTRVMEQYQPSAIVLQSGADSIAGDKLGVFNLSNRGHAACHKFMASFGVPMLVLGGGGYKIKNVARLWAYETGCLLGCEDQMQEDLPPNEFYEYFAPDYSLHINSIPSMENKNKRENLDKLRTAVLQNLSYIKPVGASFQGKATDALTAQAASGTISRQKHPRSRLVTPADYHLVSRGPEASSTREEQECDDHDFDEDASSQ
ncbi:hypothetical protein CEUSTIGMA_g10080.t1 [Chlamydomonas eustigma]|uniref:Histone deacetylase n=1 Tax=Chlamydomonas eustigma TaxID=1157962 RepID=A0A250XHU7_9CHLO|nr:hypothetical protein CEUSTIGMA_g10080.t1 [Chlamydomonas eustigma]|eukprot:GAX82654.1 hypothetical protein CEUSTIGMA_g10080.t1 [Chlamydomonas eustigma]